MFVFSPPGVFSPRSDAWLLADVVRDRGLAARAHVLDVFTGTGVVALMAARLGASAVTAVDLMRRATFATRLNTRLHGVSVDARRGDLFEPVRGARFDLITANPPYLPGAGVPPRHSASLAWEGGRDGRTLIDRFCVQVGDHLTHRGSVALVHSSLCDTGVTLAALSENGIAAEVVRTHRGPLGPLAASRAPELERAGLLRPGERSEELHVIVGRRAEAA